MQRKRSDIYLPPPPPSCESTPRLSFPDWSVSEWITNQYRSLKNSDPALGSNNIGPKVVFFLAQSPHSENRRTKDPSGFRSPLCLCAFHPPSTPPIGYKYLDWVSFQTADLMKFCLDLQQNDVILCGENGIWLSFFCVCVWHTSLHFFFTSNSKSSYFTIIWLREATQTFDLIGWRCYMWNLVKLFTEC